MIQKAVEMGVPIENAKQLSDLVLKGITKYDGQVVALQKTEFSYENGKFKKIKKEKIAKKYKDSNIVTLNNQIDTSDFTLTLSIVKLNSPGYDEFVLTNTGEWHKNPVWRLTDVIATCWSDNFTLVDESCIYQAYTSDGWYLTSCTTNKISPEVGVAHNVDLKDGHTQMAVQQTVTIRKLDSTGTLNAVGEYCHETIGLSSITVGFSVSEKPAIGFSAGIGSVLYEAEPDYVYAEY